MKKTFIRSVVNKLPTSWSKIPLAAIYWLTNGKSIWEQKRRVRSFESALRKRNELDDNMKAFLRTLNSYCLYMNRAGSEKYLDSYIGKSDFECIQRNIPENSNPKDVILICCVKNDLTRIKQVYFHHKKIGVNYMVFVDNMSDDGTLEWLLEKDVDIYRTREKYHAGAKSAWVRKVQEKYGFNRWYLLVDSDELFTYIGMEQYTVTEFVQAAEQRGLTRVRGFLLDMYTENFLFQSEKNMDDFVQEYRYFDTNSYYFENDCRGIMHRGGPRKRIFEAENDYAQPLTKYPLLRVQAEDVWADHTPMPFEKNFESECFCALRHYKFLPEDKSKFYKIAKDGNYAKGSYEYKNYINKTKQNADITFFYEGSAEFTSSDSLKAISFMRSMF